MSQELIYTSAPRGLKPGSQGFCTVVSTQGISASLVQRLEALSGYRHVFSPQDANARLNPVLFSHLILSVAGRRCHVLSRVCDAGLDHTQRTNKFAHHVVLDPREAVPGGPAWLLAAPGFMQSTWDGVPKVLPAGRQLPAANSPAAICRAWQQIAGDAGWGGALAETASAGAGRVAVIIFRPGIDLLPLLAESLALLPPQSRWNVSFCTYFNKLPPGLECQWRCVLEGSPEAIANQRLPGALVIDLGKPQGRPPQSAMVEAARTGVVSRPSVPLPGQPAVAGAYRPGDAELTQLLGQSASAPPPAPGLMPNSTADPGSVETSAAGIYDLGPPSQPHSAMDLPPPAKPRQFKRKPKSKWPLIAGLGATAAILLVGVIGLTLVMNGSHNKLEASNAKANLDKAKEAAEQAKANLAKVEKFSEAARTAKNEAQAARNAASDAANHAEHAADPLVAAAAAKDATAAADAAKSAATRASNAAEAAGKLVSNATVKDVSEVAKNNEGIAKQAAIRAARSAEEAEGFSRNAQEYAKTAAKKTPNSAQAARNPTSNPTSNPTGDHVPVPSTNNKGGANPEPGDTAKPHKQTDGSSKGTANANTKAADKTAEKTKPERDDAAQYVTLPKNTHGDTLGDFQDVNIFLPDLDCDSVLTMRLIGTRENDPEQNALFELTSQENKKEWKCRPIKASELVDLSFATFTVNGKKLSFHWSGTDEGKHEQLKNHFLSIHLKDGEQVWALRPPEPCDYVPLPCSEQSSSRFITLCRYGIPHNAVYTIEKPCVRDKTGTPIDNKDAIRSPITADSKPTRFTVGSSQPAVFSITLRKQTERARSGLVVEIKYEGLILEDRDKWLETKKFGTKLKGISKDKPVPIYSSEINEFLAGLPNEKKEPVIKSGDLKKASVKDKIKEIQEKIDTHKNDIAVEELAKTLKKEFDEREAMVLQYQICVKFDAHTIVLYKSRQ
jgi:hypothetical protein